MDQSHKSFLEPFFLEMNGRFPEAWCVLHSFETLPDYSDSDVDMALSSEDVEALERLIVNVGQSTGWSVYQKLWYDEKYCFYYVLKQNGKDHYLALDFLIDNEGIGVYGFKSSILTQDCLIFKDQIRIPSHEAAFCYKLVKRIYKERSLDEDEAYLKEHFNLSDKTKVREILTEQFGEEGSLFILNLFNQRDLVFLPEHQDYLSKLKEKYFFDFNRRTKKKTWYWLRLLNRVIYPTGLILSIPYLDENNLEKFHKMLEGKVDILFRKVSSYPTNSSLKNVKACLASTLIIVPRSELKKSQKIKISWYYGHNELIAPKKFIENGCLNTLVETAYQGLLEALEKKSNYKKVIR